jgi:23S rRNA (cytosine1962-C5)-methyltransferase
VQKVILKKGREEPVLRGHPWIFSGAIETAEGDPEAAGVADILDSNKRWLARGFYNPKTQIRVRVLTWIKEALDQEFFRRRVAQALELRQRNLDPTTNAYRIVNGEGDLLPGLVVDRYGDFLICQFATAGVEQFKTDIADTLLSLLPVKGIFERSEGRVRVEEGLEASIGVLRGEAPPDSTAMNESGLAFLVDVKHGQKTGFFLDQRDNRSFLLTLAAGRTVLDCFSYSGAFSAYALKGGASKVTALDSSRPALQLAERNLEINGFANRGELIKGDAFAYLKECEDRFDLIILDPPSLAHKRADVSAATGGYKFLNMHALKRLHTGGLLLTFCCSQHLFIDLFQKVVFGAAVDAGRKVTVLKRLGHPVDHPVSLHHPEGEYLKGLALRVLE